MIFGNLIVSVAVNKYIDHLKCKYECLYIPELNHFFLKGPEIDLIVGVTAAAGYDYLSELFQF